MVLQLPYYYYYELFYCYDFCFFFGIAMALASFVPFSGICGAVVDGRKDTTTHTPDRERRRPRRRCDLSTKTQQNPTEQ